MPSSISSSDPLSEQKNKSESREKRVFGAKVGLIVLLFFVGLEVFTRTKLFAMSKDFARFSGYPQRARTLTRSSGYKIALVGNSATERGVNKDLFREKFSELSPHKTPVVDLFVADASKINTWHFLLNCYFWKPNLTPDLTVITYYERNLEDGNALEIGRLAQFFTSPEDWSEIFTHDLPDNGDRIEFVLSSGWATFAARDRTKERVLSLLTPNYKEFVQTVSGINGEHERKVEEKENTPPQPSPPQGEGENSVPPPLGGARANEGVYGRNTHFALRRLLAAAKAHGMRLCFVAYPTRPEPGKMVGYDLDPEELRLISEAGMTFLDMRETGAQPPDHYADEIHLTPDGAKDYSEKFANQLAKRLKAGT